MNFTKVSYTALSIAVAVGSCMVHASTFDEAQADAVILDNNTAAVQDRNDVIIAFDMYYSKVPDQACYLVNDTVAECVGPEDLQFDPPDAWTGKTTIQGSRSIDSSLIPSDESFTAGVIAYNDDYAGGESKGEMTVQLTGGGGGTNPPDNDFDYENNVNGLTHQRVIYEEGGYDEIDLTIEATTATETVVDRKSDKVVAGYVSDWAQYDRKFSLESIDPSAYTKLVYSFIGICGDQGSRADTVAAACEGLELEENEIAILDLWGGFQSGVSRRLLEYGWEDYYDGVSASNYSQLNQTNVRGLMGEMLWLKKNNPDLDLAFSIGGWTLSEPFHRIADDDDKRKVFIDSVVAFVKKWGFTSVDVDWEYPGHGGESGQSTPRDPENYVKLIKEVRAALDSANLEDVTISSAIGATPEYINLVGAENYLELAGPNGPLDHIYLMNYDYWGAFTPDALGHQTNLFGQSHTGEDGENSAEKAIELLETIGVEKSRIILGVANYNRGKQGDIQVAGDPSTAENITSELVFGSHEDTVVESYDLFHNMGGDDLKGDNGFQLYTDKENNADYYYNDVTGVYYSGDTPRTGAIKAKYAEEHGLGGVFVWTVEQDYNGQLVNAMNEALGNELSEQFSTAEERRIKAETCGDNVSQEECDSLNNIDGNTEMFQKQRIQGRDIELGDGPTYIKFDVTNNGYRGEESFTCEIKNPEMEPHAVARTLANCVNDSSSSVVAGEMDEATGEINTISSSYRNFIWTYNEDTEVSWDVIQAPQGSLYGRIVTNKQALDKAETFEVTVKEDGQELENFECTVDNEYMFTNWRWPMSIAQCINDSSNVIVSGERSKSDITDIKPISSNHRNLVWSDNSNLEVSIVNDTLGNVLEK
ncbi:glycoside hydrolase family 18 protein [Vibrio astriarenae]|uniref:glycoside hydrolase family 18 protein n=1 Tax=Vibrio astriarenae TaxID=1481923 RepID=UPI0037353F11